MRTVWAARAVLAASLGIMGAAAQAHEFTAGVLAVGADREVRLADAVRGMLLAADERDGHADETSDGHLGGVDVHILPLPPELAGAVAGLTGAPSANPDFVVVIGPDTGSAPSAGTRTALVMRPGDLPVDWAESGFARRYRATYGADPSEAAAQGYNAARRLDAAIRPLDGIEPRAAVATALAETERGIEW